MTNDELILFVQNHDMVPTLAVELSQRLDALLLAAREPRTAENVAFLQDAEKSRP